MYMIKNALKYICIVIILIGVDFLIHGWWYCVEVL